jgi:hypothetical protein
MDKLVEVKNSSGECIGLLYTGQNGHLDHLNKMLTSENDDEVYFGLMEMGDCCGDFEFVMKWLRILREHPNDKIKRRTYQTLAYFCMFQQKVPDPKIILKFMMEGLYEQADNCFLEISESIMNIASGRLEEIKRRKRSKTVWIFFQKHFLCKNKDSKQKRKFSVLKNIVVNNLMRYVKIQAPVKKKDEEMRGYIKRYSLAFAPEFDARLEKEQLLKSIESGDSKDAIYAVLLISWYGGEDRFFIEAIRKAMEREMAAIRYYALKSIEQYIFNQNRWYEWDGILDLIEKFIEIGEQPHPKRDALLKKYSEGDYAISPIDYYERMDLKKIGKRMLTFIKEWREEKFAMNDIEDDGKPFNWEDYQDW